MKLKDLAIEREARDPYLLLRISELFLEQARLIRDGENEEYLHTPYKIRRKRRKTHYFRVSKSYFKKSQKTCEVLLRRHRRFHKKGRCLLYYGL